MATRENGESGGNVETSPNIGYPAHTNKQFIDKEKSIMKGKRNRYQLGVYE